MGKVERVLGRKSLHRVEKYGVNVVDYQCLHKQTVLFQNVLFHIGYS